MPAAWSAHSAVALAQTGAQAEAPGETQASARWFSPSWRRVNWINKSNVAALREGVIEKMELQIGMPVKKDGVIGVLHHEIAELTVKKSELQARAIAPEEKARAQKDVALSVCARNVRLNERQGRHGIRRRRRQGRG